MAATSGPLGQRKVFSSTPRLTGKAVVPISNYLTNERCPDISSKRVGECRNKYPETKESAFLTGMAFCKLWEYNMSRKIPDYLYDLNFMSADVDPMGCIESFLNSREIINPPYEIMDKAIRNGTITLSPPPVLGSYRIEGLTEVDFKRLYPNIDLSRSIVTDPEKWTTNDRNYELSNVIHENIGSNTFDWDLIVWSVAQHLHDYITFYYKTPNLDETVEKRSIHLYDNLEQAVTDLFTQGGFAIHGNFYHIVKM